MAFYSIGEVAERCGINPVTLRAWQRRYGLLKPQRSEGGHRQFDEADILRIEAIKRFIESGVSVSKVKALLDETPVGVEQGWAKVQEDLLATLRQVNPARLRAMVLDMGRKYSVDQFIDEVIMPVRLLLARDQNTARVILSLLDGVLIDFAVTRLALNRQQGSKEALFIAWNNDDRTRCGWKPGASRSRLVSGCARRSARLPAPGVFPGKAAGGLDGQSADPAPVTAVYPLAGAGLRPHLSRPAVNRSLTAARFADSRTSFYLSRTRH